MQHIQSTIEPSDKVTLPLSVTGPYRDAFIVHVECMEPTIKHGDMIGFDPEDTELVDGDDLPPYNRSIS